MKRQSMVLLFLATNILGVSAWAGMAAAGHLPSQGGTPRRGSAAAAGTRRGGGRFRAVIEKIMFTPGTKRGAMSATLHGELGTILNGRRGALGRTIRTLGIRRCRGQDLNP